MGDGFYRSLRLLARPFAYRCDGADHIEPGNPAVFVGNHAGSAGPIQAILALPVRLHPWIRAEMMDHSRGPAYLLDDFIRPAWRLDGGPGLAVSSLVSRLAIALFHGIGAISVEYANGLNVEAFRQSLALLLAGRSLLIFPEDPQSPPDSATGLRTFMGGFVELCRMYEHRTGAPLAVHPFAVSVVGRAIVVGPPIRIASTHNSDTAAISELVRDRVHALLNDT